MKRAIIMGAALAALTLPAAAADIGYQFRVDGMTCPFCVASSERAFQRIDGVKSASTDLELGTISVCTDGTVTFTDEHLRELFLDQGFTYRSMTKEDGCSAV